MNQVLDIRVKGKIIVEIGALNSVLLLVVNAISLHFLTGPSLKVFLVDSLKIEVFQLVFAIF